jgi:hypothetical protein
MAVGMLPIPDPIYHWAIPIPFQSHPMILSFYKIFIYLYCYINKNVYICIVINNNNINHGPQANNQRPNQKQLVMKPLTKEQHLQLSWYKSLEPSLQVIQALTAYGEPEGKAFIQDTDEAITKLSAQGLQLLGITQFNMDDLAYWTFQFLDTTPGSTPNRGNQLGDLLLDFAMDFTENNLLEGTLRFFNPAPNVLQVTFAIG